MSVGQVCAAGIVVYSRGLRFNGAGLASLPAVVKVLLGDFCLRDSAYKAGGSRSTYRDTMMADLCTVLAALCPDRYIAHNIYS